jgi:hypothetical protein
MQMSQAKLVPAPSGGYPGTAWLRSSYTGPAVPEGQGLRGGGPSGVWIWHCPRGAGPGGAWIRHGVRARHSLRGGDPGGSGAWIRHRAVARCSPRGREPSGAEQQLCRPMGWELGRLAVLLLDRGMEKPSMI